MSLEVFFFLRALFRLPGTDPGIRTAEGVFGGLGLRVWACRA